jgi:hypothetical protein
MEDGAPSWITRMRTQLNGAARRQDVEGERLRERGT